MERYSEEIKLAAVEAYCSGEQGLIATALIYNVGVSSLRKWIAGYQSHGVAGFRVKNRKLYDVEFKLAVLHRVRDEGLSFRQAAAQFDVRNFNIIGAWQRAYEQDGVAGLIPYKVTRRPDAMTNEKNQLPSLQPCEDAKRTRQELLDELNSLRLENAYLKKVEALVQAPTKSAQKPQRKS